MKDKEINIMTKKEKMLAILKSVKPGKDLSGITDIIEGGYIDSFELMTLITEICEQFSVEVTVDEIVPENFNSVDAMVAMVEMLEGRED